MEKVVLLGKVFDADKVLPSGNYYPKKVVDKALKEFQERLKTETVYGKIADINHPENIQEYNDSLFTDTSHKVVSVKEKDDSIFAEVELLNTTNGEIVEKFIEEKVPMRFAMRGVGDLNGYKEVLNFDITSIDIVHCEDNENLENTIKTKKNKKLF